MHLRHIGLAAVLLFPLAANDVPVQAGGELTPAVVRLADGRTVTAAIGAGTDEERLWLETRTDRGAIRQSVPWRSVREVEISGSVYAGAVVRAAVATLREEQTPDSEPCLQPAMVIDSSTLGPTLSTPVESPSRSTAPKVRAMDVSARLGNWDGDVPVDGLVLEIVPEDGKGTPVRCSGTVEFVLRVWKTSGRSGQTVMRSERWRVSFRPGDFESGVVRLRLPFRRIQPQRSSAWWPQGSLSVRMVVPGSDVIERTLTDLRLRPYSPLRDTLEQQSGSRFFPGEDR